MIRPTPHIAASQSSDFAATVIMPGDPLRAKFIAENFLDNVKQVNHVRNMLGYTGYYKGQRLSVMGSGIGMPSMGIYAYELFQFYEVEKIIRVGSCGAYTTTLKLNDMILVNKVFSESSFARVQSGYESRFILPSLPLYQHIQQKANDLHIPIITAAIHSSDVFYHKNTMYYNHIYETYQCQAVEMETFALFANALLMRKQAATILTVSDHLVTQQKLSIENREKGLHNMIILALEAAL